MKIKQNVTAIIELASVLLILVWLFIPSGSGPAIFYPFSFPADYAAYIANPIAKALLFAVYLVPLFALLRIVSFFIGKYIGIFGEIDSIFTASARIAITTIMIGIELLPLLRFAETPSWFASHPPLAYISAIIALALNISAVVTLMGILNHRNPVYREYHEFKKSQQLMVIGDKTARTVAVLDIFFRIRSKLFFAFIGIISLILLFLSLLILSNYRKTILEAVGDGAKSQVEQASANYRINLGDNIALFEYITRQLELNEKARFSYTDLTIFTNRKQELYLDASNATSQDFPVEYSTLASGVQYPNLAILSGSSAAEYVTAYKNSHTVIETRDNAKRTISYVSPIIIIDTVHNGEEKVKRERVLGFSVMTFSIDTIMRPYFKTRTLVLILTAFFLYLAIILTYLVGNYIVNPLLFLRMNVRKISDILSTMIRGQSRVTSSTLVYIDCVNSRDEIKSLSTEINDMVTVIRGIVPYISASTLKQAETGLASTTRKELAFLFTDIRGFTTLCEGMQPEEVVTILNNYLDLETEIILNNHGDVDKFVGDEMMAFFEGPLKEENACRAAMQIRTAMMEEKERREKSGLPIVAIGIGVNSGAVIFGSVGARDRMDFTSIGDTVNLAARLEGANKAYGSKSIITEAVYEEVKERFICRELDYIAVKGKNEPVRIFEILQEKPLAQPKLMEIKILFEKGLQAYRARKWEEAATVLRKNVDLYNDAPSAVFLERIEHFSNNPPPDDWDGVFRMTVK